MSTLGRPPSCFAWLPLELVARILLLLPDYTGVRRVCRQWNAAWTLVTKRAQVLRWGFKHPLPAVWREKNYKPPGGWLKLASDFHYTSVEHGFCEIYMSIHRVSDGSFIRRALTLSLTSTHILFKQLDSPKGFAISTIEDFLDYRKRVLPLDDVLGRKFKGMRTEPLLVNECDVLFVTSSEPYSSEHWEISLLRSATGYAEPAWTRPIDHINLESACNGTFAACCYDTHSILVYSMATGDLVTALKFQADDEMSDCHVVSGGYLCHTHNKIFRIWVHQRKDGRIQTETVTRSTRGTVDEIAVGRAGTVTYGRCVGDSWICGHM